MGAKRDGQDEGRPADQGGAEPFTNIRFPDESRSELDAALLRVTALITGVQRSQERLRALIRANALVAGTLTLADLLSSVAEAARDLAHADHASLDVFGTDPSQDLAAGSLPEGLGRDGSFLDVPIRVGDRILGNLVLSAAEPGAFQPEDEELVVALAATAAVAIEHARLYAKSELQRTWLEAAVEVTRHLLTRTDDSLDMVLRHASEAADADAAALVILRPGRGWIVEAVSGPAGSLSRGASVQLDATAAGRAILAGKPILLDDIRAEGTLREAARRGLGPAMAVPLVSIDGTTFGSVSIARRAAREKYTHDDLAQVNAFANLVGVALELDRAFRDRELKSTADDHARIAADLHDHVIQDLFATGMHLESVATLLPRGAAHHAVLTAVDTLDHTIRTIRSSIFHLRIPADSPASLHHILLGIVESQHAALGFSPTITLSGEVKSVEDHLLVGDVAAVAMEALSNVARHAHASAATVEVVTSDGEITVTVSDDGLGMGERSPTSGLVSLRARAEARHGTFVVEALSAGGTRVIWTAPYDRSAGR